MKKFFCIFLCAALLALLCGCNGYAEIDSKYLVSAMGFDNIDGRLHVFAEIISSDGEIKQNRLLKASGDNAKQAVFNLGPLLARALVVDHCAVLAIGESVEKETFLDIMEFCRDVKNLNLGVYMICCRDIPSVFSAEPMQTAVGYDIMELLKRRRREDGTDYNNRFYEIEQLRSAENRVFSLPLMTLEENAVCLQGERIYVQDEPALQLSNTESAVYSIICNRFTGGNIFVDEESAHILSAQTEFSMQQDSKGSTLALRCEIDTKKQTKNFTSALENAAMSLISRAQNENAAEIFSVLQEQSSKNTGALFSHSTKITFSLTREGI